MTMLLTLEEDNDKRLVRNDKVMIVVLTRFIHDHVSHFVETIMLSMKRTMVLTIEESRFSRSYSCPQVSKLGQIKTTNNSSHDKDVNKMKVYDISDVVSYK